MKKHLIIYLLLLISGMISGQDTIFVKNGDIIPATIISRDEMEIRYKKFGQTEPAAIYSVFISDVKSIHFADGIIADFTKTVSLSRNERPVDLAGTTGTAKFSLGMSGAYFNRRNNDDMSRFWNIHAAGNDVISNPRYYPIELRMNLVTGQLKRNWIGTGLELIITPDDMLYSSSSDHSDEFKFKSFYYNIPLYYGHTLNHKKTVILLIEPALDLSFMSGYIKINNNRYLLQTNFGSGWHLSAGIDWIVTKRLLASFRVGQRHTKVKESHKDENSATGYSSFYVNRTINDDLLTIKFNGPYASLGLSWCMYFRMKGFRPE